jgi:hypothetical protein
MYVSKLSDFSLYICIFPDTALIMIIEAYNS